MNDPQLDAAQAAIDTLQHRQAEETRATGRVAKKMTVKELIDHLGTMPQDAIVLYKQYSDFSVLEAEEIELILARSGGAFKRNGLYKSSEDWSDKNKEDPGNEPVTVVVFPGN